MSANIFHFPCSSQFTINGDAPRITSRKEYARHCQYNADNGILTVNFGNQYCRMTGTVQLHPDHQQGNPLDLDVILCILGYILLTECRKRVAMAYQSKAVSVASAKAVSKITSEMVRDHRKNMRMSVNSSVYEARKAAHPRIMKDCNKVSQLASNYISSIFGEHVEVADVGQPPAFVDYYARRPRVPRVVSIRTAVVDMPPPQPHMGSMMPPTQPHMGSMMPPPQPHMSPALLNQQYLETMMLPAGQKNFRRPKKTQLSPFVEEIEMDSPVVSPADVSSGDSSIVRADLEHLTIDLNAF